MVHMIRELSRDAHTLDRLTVVWESAVRETHHFLDAQAIIKFRPLVRQELSEIEMLLGHCDDKGQIQGFIGVAENKIEMLFVHSATRGQGIGKQLAQYAINELNSTLVDVNEQNSQAVGFYKHMGFHILSRSETDNLGNPYPILHMGLPPAHTKKDATT